MNNTVTTFQKAKGNKKISMLTAYDYTTASMMDKVGINGILVGDSLGNVILGYEDTISVTMEDMIHHSKAVARGAKHTLVITDMPFMSYQTSVNDALVNAGRLMKEGRADCVKLEGGAVIFDEIKAITQAGIPVMGHIGLTPQSVNSFGGFKVQGKDMASALKLIEDAIAVQEAGAFAIVMECVPSPIADLITKRLSIPTIGIGAGAGCDGQVLVSQDMLGMFTDFTPKFVKQFGHINKAMEVAFTEYIQEVQDGTFPEAAHSFEMDKKTLANIKAKLPF